MRHLSSAFCAVLVLGCVDPSDGNIEDAIDASAAGKSDSIVEGSEDAAAILALVNDPLVTLEMLDDDAGLSRNVATRIIALREAETVDDLTELDAVPYVGPATMARLAAYAHETLPSHDAAHHSSAVLTADTTWSPMTPMLGIGKYTVPAGVTLTITAGRKLEVFDSLVIEGSLVIKGVRSAPVAFLGDSGDVPGFGWKGITCRPGGRVILDHAVFTEATTSVTIESGCAAATMRGLTILEFGTAGVVVRGTDVDIDGLVAARDSGHGNGLSVEPGGEVTVRNAVFSDLYVGVRNYGTAVVDHATFAANRLNYVTDYDSHTTIRDSIMSAGWVGDPDGALTMDRVLLSNVPNEADLPATASVLHGDPMFRGTDNYRLMPGSPAVNAGKGGLDHDLAGSARDGAPDLGAFELVH